MLNFDQKIIKAILFICQKDAKLINFFENFSIFDCNVATFRIDRMLLTTLNDLNAMMIILVCHH